MSRLGITTMRCALLQAVDYVADDLQGTIVRVRTDRQSASWGARRARKEANTKVLQKTLRAGRRLGQRHGRRGKKALGDASMAPGHRVTRDIHSTKVGELTMRSTLHETGSESDCYEWTSWMVGLNG
jgi:hypothetical protein